MSAIGFDLYHDKSFGTAGSSMKILRLCCCQDLKDQWSKWALTVESAKADGPFLVRIRLIASEKE